MSMSSSMYALRIIQGMTTLLAIILFGLKLKKMRIFLYEFPWLLYLFNLICFYTVIFLDDILGLGIRHTYGTEVDFTSIWSAFLRLHLLGTLLAYTITINKFMRFPKGDIDD